MRKSSFYFTLLLSTLLAGVHLDATAQNQSATTWKRLFNGKDLSGWQTYLRPSQAAADKTPIGLDKDPHGVFTVKNGLIRVSGQDWGGFFTKESFQNYHLRFQVKFGQAKWAPREHVVADGGLLFHCSAPYDFGSTCWMRSVELQIQETDIGDYHNVGAGIPLLQFSKGQDDDQAVDQYDPSAPLQATTSRVFRSGNFESAPDEWTKTELIARGADAVFIVNGFVVNRLYNLFRADLNQQTTRGQLQFQSEGAEHFLKDIELRPIDFQQNSEPKLVAGKSELVLSGRDAQTVDIVNQGAAVELIAVELIGKNLEQFSVQLPSFPLVLKKGDKLSLPVTAKAGSGAGNTVKLRLETALGPVPDFVVRLTAK
jgi:hypothetical protein